MSGMANEMAARMAAEGQPAQEPGGVPGNAGAVPPPAGASNTDTAPAGQGPPESIPYARFKEVNDRLSSLRGYEELSQYGYDADSLRRLASFEQQYLSDPIGTWKSMAVNLDLPQELMEAINAHGGTPPAPQQAEGTTDNLGASAAALSEEDRRRLDYVDQMRTREEEAQRGAILDRIVAIWDDLDRQEGVSTSKRTQLTWIAAMTAGQANGGQSFRTAEELARAARVARMEERDLDLGAAVLSGNVNRGAPPALPGSLPTPAGPVKFGSLREAGEAAEADIIAGRLAPL